MNDFSFCIVENQIKRAYDESNCSWSLEQCVQLFALFYEAYEKSMGRPHPRMRTATIRSVIEKLDTVTDTYGRRFQLDLEDYPELITGYFAQPFPDCNYSIAHFTSGAIRINRCFESGVL